jgi:hypothetical protein
MGWQVTGSNVDSANPGDTLQNITGNVTLTALWKSFQFGILSGSSVFNDWHIDTNYNGNEFFFDIRSLFDSESINYSASSNVPWLQYWIQSDVSQSVSPNMSITIEPNSGSVRSGIITLTQNITGATATISFEQGPYGSN